MINEKRFGEYSNTFSILMETANDTSNNFIPQKRGDNISIAAGVDRGSYAISIESKEIDIEIKSTELIQVSKYKIPDNKMAVLFSLSDDSLLSIFISFAIDLESVIEKNPSITINEIYNRYVYWQRMFKVEANKISEMLVKGLVGELNILDQFMIPKYGVQEAIRGWVGTEKNHKDFSYSDGMWYEAKTINIGKLSVKISSIEQLQADTEGVLLITEIEKAGIGNPNGVRLFDLLNKIKNIIDSEDTVLSFFNKINDLGISLDVFSDPNHEGNLHRYLIHKVSNYLVNTDFPKLNREELPVSVGAVNYELILTEIQDYLVDFN
ncbi:PD-(D/E)XK motif protein [Desemzia sp. FAM 24101]|uniref:PD-(D/E)XK motif protein n=1 Tax=unclassified Desemzia TaxID=2685243 RepID=UPI00388A9F75